MKDKSEACRRTDHLAERFALEGFRRQFRLCNFGIEPILYDEGMTDSYIRQVTRNIVDAYLSHYHHKDEGGKSMFRDVFSLWYMSLNIEGKGSIVDGMYRGVTLEKEDLRYTIPSGPSPNLLFERLCVAVDRENETGEDLLHGSMTGEELMGELFEYTSGTAMSDDVQRISFDDVPKGLMDEMERRLKG